MFLIFVYLTIKNCIVALLYTYTKYKDQHTLTNGEAVPMSYTITKITCEATKVLKTGVIPASTTIPITFIEDGDYLITLDKGTGPENVPLIKTYNNLLLSIITFSEKLFCGCSKCDDCQECNECENYLSALVKAFAFNSLNAPLYQPYINLIAEASRCDYKDTVLCNLLHERVYGNSDIKEVMLRTLAFYYAAFYYKDLFLAVDQEERDYTTAKYKFSKIGKCIKKLGIMPQEILDTYESNIQVYYWQIDNTGENALVGITEINAALNSVSLITHPVSSIEEFEEGKIVSYTLIGKRVFAITPTQMTDFIVEDSLGNDITDQFDTIYRNDLSLVLFVSKIPYSISSTYFKFKRIV